MGRAYLHREGPQRQPRRLRGRSVLNGDAAACVLDVYRRHGVRWAELRGDRLEDGGWLDRFRLLLPDAAEVLDVGCGSGLPIARELQRRGYPVTGVDGAAEMLAMFRRNVPRAAAVLGDMRALALDAAFGRILAWDSLFHLRPDDQRPLFARLARHSAPGAVLMFTSGPAEGSAVGEIGGDPLYHGSLDPEEYRSLLDVGGFDVVDHVVEDPRCGFRTVWLARRRD